MNNTSLLLVDDHAVMRMGLASLLETCRDITVLGDAGEGETAIRKALRLRPDVVVMDLMMPEMDGIETTRHLTVLLAMLGAANRSEAVTIALRRQLLKI